MTTTSTRLPLSPVFTHRSVMHLLRARAAERPDFRVFTFLVDGEGEEAPLTYAMLDRQSRAIAAEMQRHGLAGSRALLIYPPGLEYLCAFYGCLYAGVVAVPAYPPDPMRLRRTLPRLMSIVADAQTTVVLTTSMILSMAEILFEQAPALRELKWIATDALEPGAEDAWQEPAVDGETLAFLQYTSGSTGHPKGVMVTHENLRQNARIVSAGVPPCEDSVVVNWAPMYHDLGLIGLGIICPLFWGIPIILLSPLDFLHRPITWLRAVTRYRATNCGAPNFAYDLCVRRIPLAEREGLDLSSWEVALNGAEPVRAETIERFAEAFAPWGFRREAFYPSYGLAEATLMVTGGVKMAGPRVRWFSGAALEEGRVAVEAAGSPAAKALVSCGGAWLEGQVVIVNPRTAEPCPPGRIGEIWVRGPFVARGYFGRGEESAETFRVTLAGTGEGPFLRTGDLGFLLEGELYVTGRLKDLIIVRGRNHYPQDIEATVERSHASVRIGCSAAFTVTDGEDERVIVVAEVTERDGGPELSAVRAAIRGQVAAEHQLRLHEVVLVKSGSIPKTSSGKLQRRATRDAFLTGALERVPSSPGEGRA